MLHVMADFMSDDVRLGKVAGSTKSLLQLAKKTSCRDRRADLRDNKTGRPRIARIRSPTASHSKQGELGLAVLATELAELLVPDILGIGEDDRDELSPLVVDARSRRRGARFKGRHGAAIGTDIDLLQERERIAAQQPDYDYQQQRAQSAAHHRLPRHSAHAHSAAIFDIGALPSTLPAHDSSLSCWGTNISEQNPYRLSAARSGFRRHSEHEVEFGGQLADFRIIDRCEIDRNQVAQLFVPHAAPNAVAFVARMALDIELRG